MTDDGTQVHDARVVIATDRFDDDLAALTGDLGFRIDVIHPADAPSTAVVSGHGLSIRLHADERARPTTLELLTEEPRDPVTLPGGTIVTCRPPDPPMVMPENVPSLVVTRDHDASGIGRAGMHYRDLLPDRWGGRFIASHITIPDGGPVPDYVHFHQIRFQLIFVKSGWVRVVYEDQGEPFVMHAGDAVLQPPRIRHRVLESSAGLEVIEIGCPAEHETRADHALELPNGVGSTERSWDGQRFVRHIAVDAHWSPWRAAGWEYRDTGIGAATDGLAGVRIARPLAAANGVASNGAAHDGEFAFHAVLAGEVTLTGRDGDEAARLSTGDSVAIPAGHTHAFVDPSDDCELLEVTLPAEPTYA